MRDEARAIVGPTFREVYVSTALACCEVRDPKDCTRRRGAVRCRNSRVSAPYELPVAADLEIDTGRALLATCVDTLMQFACAQFGGAVDAGAARMRRG